jgi:hypothetical protein
VGSDGSGKRNRREQWRVKNGRGKNDGPWARGGGAERSDAVTTITFLFFLVVGFLLLHTYIHTYVYMYIENVSRKIKTTSNLRRAELISREKSTSPPTYEGWNTSPQNL